MSLLPKFLMKIVKVAPTSEGDVGNMSIIIQRPYSHLEKGMRSVFKGEKDVKIIVDSRRFDERRASQQTVEVERRHSNQRQPNEELVEVIIST